MHLTTKLISPQPDHNFYIDTCYTPDHGWETMVFRCNAYGTVISWDELDCYRYPDENEAKIGHCEVVTKWMNK
jgi:hypothetical protein